MPRKQLSIPFNGDFFGITQLLKEFAPFIAEIYLPINPLAIGSGRVYSGPLDYYDAMVGKLIQIAHQFDIQVAVLVNPLSFREVLGRTQTTQRLFHTIEYYFYTLEADKLVTTSPVVARQFAKIVPTALAVNFFVNSYDKLRYAEDLGVQEVCVDRDKNRDLEFLRNLKAHFRFQIKVIVNEGCIPDCCFRIAHFDLLSEHHQEKLDRGANYDDELTFSGCRSMYIKFPDLFIRSPFIRPEDLPVYEPFVDIFKISGRSRPTDHIRRFIKAYVDRSWVGGLEEIVENPMYNLALKHLNLTLDNTAFPRDFIHRVTTCRRECFSCTYCLAVFDRVAKPRPRPSGRC